MSRWDTQINTEGLDTVGEVTSRTMREALVEEDYRNAWIAGAHAALNEVAKFAEQRIAIAGEFDDVRALQDLKVWVGDKIREVHSTATNGN